MRYIANKFDSVGKCLHYLDAKPNNKVFSDAHYRASSKEGNGHWYGTKTYEEADNLFRTGDRELFKRIQVQERKRAKGTGVARKNQYYTSVCGFVPHVPNFVQGMPNNMINKKVVRYQSSKVVTIVYNSTVCCAVDIEDMINASLNVINRVCALEAQGYRCNLYIMHATKVRDETAVMMVKIKSSDDYMDRLKLVYPMVHPSMLRRHFFKYIEVCDIRNNDFRVGYGSVIDDMTTSKNIIKDCGIKADEVYTYETAKRLK